MTATYIISITLGLIGIVLLFWDNVAAWLSKKPASWPSDKGPSKDAERYISAMIEVSKPGCPVCEAMQAGNTPFEFAKSFKTGEPIGGDE